MTKKIAILAGDGIGPEIMDSTRRVLDAALSRKIKDFEFNEALIGGAAYDEFSEHLPQKTIEICEKSDAILFASVGGPVSESHLPKWQNCETNSLLGLRKHFNLNVNFRPSKVYSSLQEICPLKNELIKNGVDILIVRELSSGIYFGEHKTYENKGKRIAQDVCEYDEETIAAISHVAFQAAQKRNKRLVSVDKANVLDSSKLWRAIVKEVSVNYPNVELQDMLVDNCAMQIIKNPAQFDVILTSNMFGDILSDSAAVLPGSLGLTPSASLNSDSFGMYEPSGGSAPDIAGKGVVNPIAQILSAAMMLKFSFNLVEEANRIEDAVKQALNSGKRTVDIALKGESFCSTDEMTESIITFI